jgi:hypothetical protein
MPRTVEALLQDIRLLGEDQFQVVQAVRTLVTRTLGPTVEEVRYGGILFTSGVPFGGVFAYKSHVSVEFSHGAGIHDALGFLEGGGKGRRHIKLHGVGDLSDKKPATYLPRALAAARSGQQRLLHRQHRGPNAGDIRREPFDGR